MLKSVITYQNAYVPGESTLCAHHAEHPTPDTPALGPVSHGQRLGACDVCESGPERTKRALLACGWEGGWDDPEGDEFITRVYRALETGKIDAVINEIVGGASWGEARDTAVDLLAAYRSDE